jgi:hypothetical protein
VEAWHAVLGELDEETARLAAIDLMDSITQFPAPAQVLAAARDMMRSRMNAPKALSAAAAAAEQGTIKEMLRRLYDGSAKAADFGVDRAPETDFARRLFPAITDELIQKNWLELKYARERLAACSGCFSVRQCPTNGLMPVLTLRPDGWMMRKMVGCGLTGEPKSERRA